MTDTPVAPIAPPRHAASTGNDCRIEIAIHPIDNPAPESPGARDSSRRIIRHERERKRRRHIENRRIIRELKMAGCWLCGRADLPSTLLHFHHVDPATKKAAVAHFTTRSTGALIAEINKCRLICVDCHETHHETITSEAWRTGGCYDL
jgi:hypothetical protein